MDEATASIDPETDELIQQTIRTKFLDCTILAIAHRLNTIMEYTKIMVIDQGKLVEFGSPKQLLLDNKTLFYSLALNAGVIKAFN